MGLLRILLALCVFFGHSRPLGRLAWLGADSAVELFFVVSGFYMQLILRTKYTKDRLGETWVYQFYKARYFRLLPVYIAGCLLASAAAVARPHSPAIATWHYVADLANTPQNLLFKAFLIFTNLTMLLQDLTMFFASHGGAVHWSANFGQSDVQLWQALAITPAWSLGTELSFYLIAPYLLKLRSRWLGALVICCLASKAIILFRLHLGDPWTYRFFPFELSYFVAGALAFRYYSRLKRRPPGRIERLLVYPFAVILSTMHLPGNEAKLIYPLALALCLPLMFRITATNETDRMIGELSYPFYLYHMSALVIASWIQQVWHMPVTMVVYVGLTVTAILSIISLSLELRFIESWRGRFSEPSKRVEAPNARVAITNGP